MTVTDTYLTYQDGYLTPLAALRALCLELGEVESDLAPLNEQRDVLRARISEVLLRIEGEKAEIRGFGVVRLTNGSLSDKYDAAQLNALAVELDEAGHEEIARRIVACKAKSFRAGGLRVERERS